MRLECIVPWDQNRLMSRYVDISLKKLMKEVDAIDNKDRANLREEPG